MLLGVFSQADAVVVAALIAAAGTFGGVWWQGRKTQRQLDTVQRENRDDHAVVAAELRDVKAGMSGLRGDVGELRADVGELRVDVGDLRGDVQALQRDGADLDGRVDRLEHPPGGTP